MNPANSEETVFAEAQRLSPVERGPFLHQATRGDAALRRRIETLLRAYDAGEFLEEAAAPETRAALRESIPPTEKAGDRIGRYKLLQEIGEGGCGIVYMAEQEEPVRRRVALKIIKLGMDTKSVIARFEAERQALALMDHPNIAKVLDAGATETGRPYFVMELVRGLRITDYCDQARLSTRARLDLFIQVCQAIQHAHQKGIIHRDIKPSNILVSTNDGVAVPKVIDFGIAKATSGQRLTDKTLFTAFEQFIGTPAYMSPEQAVITNVDVDTRSDVYALGVLLYELLTGRTPFDAKDLLAIGLDEMRRTIRDTEPPKPSTRVSTLPGDEASTTARCRGLDAPRLVRELHGDLDWIVMKALEKDRARRYETANGLAADVLRHLNNEAVVACPPSRMYRFQKAVRRNKFAFATAAAVVAALAIGLALSLWRFAKEREALKRAVAAERIATAERNSTESVLRFVRDKILSAGRPEGLDGGMGRDVTLREAIQRAETEIASAFTNHPLVEAKLRETIGDSYIHLGDAGLALPQAERAFALYQERLGIEDPLTVGAMGSVRRAHEDAGMRFEFLPFYTNAFASAQRKWGLDHTNTLSVMNELATAYSEAKRYDDAIRVYGDLIRLRAARFGTNTEVIENMGGLARTLAQKKDIARAIALLEQVCELGAARWGPTDRRTFICLNDLAAAYHEGGRLERAVEVYLDALRSEAVGPRHASRLITLCNLAVAYRDLGKAGEAISRFKETLRLRQAALGPSHPDTIQTMILLGKTLAQAKQFDEAFPLLGKAIELRMASLGRTNRLTLDAMSSLAWAYGYDTTGSRLEESTSLFEETLKLRKEVLGPNHEDTLNTMDNLARDYAWARRFDDAIDLLRKLELMRGPDHPRNLYLMDTIGFRCSEAGKLNQALDLWEPMFHRAKARLGPDDDATRRYSGSLASLYRRMGKTNQLEALYQDCLTTPGTNGLGVRIEIGRVLLESWIRPGIAPGSPEEERVRAHVADVRRHCASDRTKLAEHLQSVAELRHRQGSHAEATSLHREILELRRAASGADSHQVLEATANLAGVLGDWAWAERDSKPNTRPAAVDVAGRAREAEKLWRQVLASRLPEGTNSWRVGQARSGLGGALVAVAVTDPALEARGREALFGEAETLLLESHPQLQWVSAGLQLLRDAVERLQRLYMAWDQPEKLATWRREERVLDAMRLANSASQLLDEDKPEQAEAPARESLAIREKHVPDDWRTFNARSLLGDSLLGQRKYAEAEPLLREGYEGLKQRQAQIPPDAARRIREALERLVRLYVATGRADQASEWKGRLAEFHRTMASKTPGQAK